MNILWLSHLVPYPPKSGVLQRSYHLLKALAQRHDVHLVAFIQQEPLRSMFRDEQDGLRQARGHLGKFCRSLAFVRIPATQGRYGMERLALRSLFRGPYTINWLESRDYRSILTDLQQRHSFDIVHVDTISLAPYAGLFPTARTALDHHNVESHMMSRRALMERNPLKRLYYWQEGVKLRRYEQRVCPNFHLNVTCSTLDAQRLATIVRTQRTIVVPNGVDTEYFVPVDTPCERHSLIFAGGLNWYPNRNAMSFFADRVWPRLKAAVPDVTMNLIGKNPPRRFTDLARADPAFRVHGFVDDVRPYIGRAHAYICPILEGGGTKLKVLDALAMGAALVASPEACEGLDVEHEKNVLIANSPQEYVQHLTKIFADDTLRARLGIEARNLAVERYSFAEIGREFASAYEGLLNGDD